MKVRIIFKRYPVYYYAYLTASFTGQFGYADTGKAETFWILMKQEMMVSQCHQLGHVNHLHFTPDR